MEVNICDVYNRKREVQRRAIGTKVVLCHQKKMMKFKINTHKMPLLGGGSGREIVMAPTLELSLDSIS